MGADLPVSVVADRVRRLGELLDEVEWTGNERIAAACAVDRVLDAVADER